MADSVLTTPTVAGSPIPEHPDLPRMRRDRIGRLRREMESRGLDALVLIGTSNVSYATGALAPGTDSSRALLARPVVVMRAGEEWPHLFTPYPDGAPPEMPADHLHGAVFPDLPEGASDFVASALGDVLSDGGRVAFDDMTHALRRALGSLGGAGGSSGRVEGASAILAAAKLQKTADELACIRTAQRLNEQAMRDVLPLVRPGARQCELSARFLRRIHELGATSNGIDPIWQPMPPYLAEGPWTTHGGVAFPTGSHDLFLREGDVVWVDTGIGYQGYASDFGRTWLVSEDPRPSTRQKAQFERWSDVVAATLERCKPGATGLELVRAACEANGGPRPWIEHFYLSHGVGTDSAEMPLIGTDLGEAFDESIVLAPGMVLVIEPVIWDDGAAGYRSEDIYAVTDDGWVALSDFPFDPFGPSGPAGGA